MWTPRFPFGLEGTEQIILERNYLPKRERTSPRGEQTTAQSKCKHETEQNISFFAFSSAVTPKMLARFWGEVQTVQPKFSIK